MKTFIVGALLLAGLAGCSDADQAKIQTALATPKGQLFCKLQKPAGAIIVPVIDAEAAAINPGVGLASVLVTGKLAATVQTDCDLAAAAVGATVGIPVAPSSSVDTSGAVAIKPADATT